MDYLLTNFPHGNGPYMRAIDLAIAINKERATRGLEELGIIVPLMYGERQKRIIQAGFKDALREKPDLIVFDANIGEMLEQLVFKGTGHYQENLESFIEKQQKLELSLKDRLSWKVHATTFSGSQIEIHPANILAEINHNPRLVSGLPSYYTTIAYFSEILENTLAARLEGFREDTLKAAIPLARKIEDAQTLRFMPDPFVFSYNKDRQPRDEIWIPPFVHTPKQNEEKVKPGMYVMITGIEGLRHLFDDVQRFGFKLYCPPFIEDLEGADNSHAPDFVSNPNIMFQYARTGWSSVWLSHLTETPLITPTYAQGDDPEIFFNERTMIHHNMAAIHKHDTNAADLITSAESLKQTYRRINEALRQNYGTTDGIDYAAKIIVTHMVGEDISAHRKIRQVI